MTVFYNENDAKAAAWLRELIRHGLIRKGVVDERSITDLRSNDLLGFERVHLFAGIGGWDYALNLAGWGTRPVWSGSCPCQPFSSAGKRNGHSDHRHLWPEMLRLITECRPPVVFGEQVASRLGREWLAGVFADLEDVGYAVAGADLCAAGVGAPHIRQRLYWVAYADNGRRYRESIRLLEREPRQDCAEASWGAQLSGLATPTSRDWKDGSSVSGVPENALLGRQVHGTTTESSDSETGRRGVLNPALSRWLMGYPEAWCQAAISAYRTYATQGRRA